MSAGGPRAGVSQLRCSMRHPWGGTRRGCWRRREPRAAPDEVCAQQREPELINLLRHAVLSLGNYGRTGSSMAFTLSARLQRRLATEEDQCLPETCFITLLSRLS